MFLMARAQDVYRAGMEGGEVNIFCGPKREAGWRPKSVDFCQRFRMDLFTFPEVRDALIQWAEKIHPGAKWDTRFSLENEYCEFYIIFEGVKT